MTDCDFFDQMTIFDLLDEGQEKDFRTMNIEEIADYIGRKIGAKFVYGHDITEYAATKDKMTDKLDTLEEYKRHKAEKHAEMVKKQNLPYDVKIRMAENRIHSFYGEACSRGVNCHVSVGGLDSITLACFVRKLGYSEKEIPLSIRG